MTALKWTITTQERNALVETHLGCIWWTINKNRRLISAAGLNCKDAAKLYGIKGAPYGARDLTVSLDALVETGVQFCGGGGLNV